MAGAPQEALRGRHPTLPQTAPKAHGGVRPAYGHDVPPEGGEGSRVHGEAPRDRCRAVRGRRHGRGPGRRRWPPTSSVNARFHELEAGRPLPPDQVRAAWLRGDHTLTERREATPQPAGGVDAAGRRMHHAFLAPARKPGEGTDITSEPRGKRSPPQTPAAPRPRSSRTPAGHSASTRTAPPRRPGSSSRCSSSPAKTRTTRPPAPRSALHYLLDQPRNGVPGLRDGMTAPPPVDHDLGGGVTAPGGTGRPLMRGMTTNSSGRQGGSS